MRRPTVSSIWLPRRSMIHTSTRHGDTCVSSPQSRAAAFSMSWAARLAQMPGVLAKPGWAITTAWAGLGLPPSASSRTRR